MPKEMTSSRLFVDKKKNQIYDIILITYEYMIYPQSCFENRRRHIERKIVLYIKTSR